jgi:quercetin dioxygenase-like cupin family protein
VNYPRTIDDGAGGRMTFLGVSHDEHGERLDVTSTVDPGAGPPMHVHHLQSETVTVRSGRIGVAIPGEGERFAGPGETITFEAGVAHRFWNAGDDQLVLDGEVRPPHNMEYFLTQIYASTAAHGGRPGAFDGAFLLTRYRSEFAMTAIPAPVRRIVFPVQVLLGRLLGRYAHFADAPPPVKPSMSATLPGRTTSARSSAG